MTDITRISSITTLIILSFFCFQTGIFLCAGHTIKKNARRTLIFIDFFTGFLLLFDSLAYFYRGNTSITGYYMVRLCNFFVFVCNFSISFLFCFYVCEFIKQSRLSFTIIFNPKNAIKDGIPLQLFVVLSLSLCGIILTIISQFTNLFYYFDENNLYHRSSLYFLSIILGLLPSLITLTLLIQKRKQLRR